MTHAASLRIALCLSTLVAPAAGAQDFPLNTPTGLVARDATIDSVEVFGRTAIRLTTDKAEGFVFIPGVEFQDGTIEVDLALKTTTPPGVRMPGFIGVMFRARPDASAYDMFYIRPGNSRSDDQAMRSHVVQYVAHPGFGWYELRRGWPWVYESHAAIEPEAWTHVRIEVAGRAARLFLNRSPQPALIVDGLKGQDLRGAVALWGFAGEEAYFSNLKITSAPPQPVKNGTDVAGTWQVKLATDYGVYDGTLQLRREERAVTGTWSGGFGNDLKVTGTWRDGYVELTFTGEWPALPGSPAKKGPATTTLAGWFDGASGTGRGRVEGRADGRWTATRVP
jgi:hypothetical protein